jgi:hypothetical protein
MGSGRRANAGGGTGVCGVTYGGTVARYHFKYVLMNPSMHPDVREALAKELEHRSTKTGKKIDLVRHAEGGQVLRPRVGRRVRQELGPHRGAPGLLERVRGEDTTTETRTSQKR